MIGAGFGYVMDDERALFDRVADSPAELVQWIGTDSFDFLDRID